MEGVKKEGGFRVENKEKKEKESRQREANS